VTEKHGKGRRPGAATAAAAALLIACATVGGPLAGEPDPVPRKLLWEGTVPAKPEAAARPLREARRALIPFATAPFPFDGPVPPLGQPFLDVEEEGRRGRRSPRTGEVHWQETTYADNRVLLVLPKGFDANRPALIVLYLHGNKATLERDVEGRQELPRQVAQSGLNAALVAPQLAVDAWDSSAGGFWEEGRLAQFLEEAGERLAALHGHSRAKALLARAPVVIIAYSGGYLPAVWSLHHGGAAERIAGVVILDGLYAEPEKFADWIASRRGFFVSAFGLSSVDGNAALHKLLMDLGHEPQARLGRTLTSGSVVLLDAGRDAAHHDFVTRAWARDPVTAVLSRIPGYQRSRRR
jgi:hypothetical protein